MDEDLGDHFVDNNLGPSCLGMSIIRDWFKYLGTFSLSKIFLVYFLTDSPTISQNL